MLDDDSIDCCISSPPYWSLRDYGIEPTVWGGDVDCEHEFEIKEYKNPSNRNGLEGKQKYKSDIKKHNDGVCIKCGAWKGSLGLEPNFELFIQHLCNIYDLVKQKLKPSGTCWINLGDTYGGSSIGKSYAKHKKGPNSILPDKVMYSMPKVGHSRGKYDKCLLMLPQRFGIEMINRGWILRNVIVWHKNNCMPSSARDRFTVDFEYVYFFVKAKKYWFDQDAVREPLSNSKSNMDRRKYKPATNAIIKNNGTQTGVKPSNAYNKYHSTSRTKRCVWNINTHPNPEAHFATFPPKLVIPMIKVGCPQYVCKECGKGRKRIIDNSKRINTRPGKNTGNMKSGKNIDPNKELHNSDLSKYRQQIIYKTTGWTDCGCNAGWKPGIVLDPFAGSGTTLKQAWKLGRSYIGFEISKNYMEIIERTLNDTNNHRIDQWLA
jgi:DNA modification methylase